MKKYNLLWHLFELEPRAHDFLDSYVQRIETYAHNHHINNDILDDIKYNIIEKLYTAQSPINEAFVMNLAETIGEPEQIFEVREAQDEESETQSNILERWFWKDKPMIWWVAYRIAKSLNIPVAIVRLIFLIAVFIYGTSIWLYPLLALFVPYQDKKKSSGQVGNLFFEIIRVLIWWGVIFLLWSALFWTIFGISVVSILPTLSNQSLQGIIPRYLYPLVIVAMIALLVLLIGSLWALIKKNWLSKTLALICIIIIIGSTITAGLTGFMTVNKYNYNPKTIDTSSVGSLSTDDGTVIINLSSDQQIAKANYMGNFFGEEFKDVGIFQEIKLLASTGTELYVETVDSVNILSQNNSNHILSMRTKPSMSTSGNTVNLTLPNNIFSQKVPFSFAERTINIYIPKDKKVIYNNKSNLRYRTPSMWYEYGESDRPQKAIYCVDKRSFIYYETYQSWRCADTNSSEVNKEQWYLADWDENTFTDPQEDSNKNEETIKYMFEWLTLTQAQEIAQSKGRVLRVAQENGKTLTGDVSHHPGRINLDIHDGRIVDISIED